MDHFLGEFLLDRFLLESLFGWLAWMGCLDGFNVLQEYSSKKNSVAPSYTEAFTKSC